jgi:hypothetical protein
MPDLQDAHHKFMRGKENLSEFYDRVLVAFDRDKIDFKIEHEAYSKPPGAVDPQPWYAFTAIVSSVPKVAKADCVLLAQAVECFRSSLDYVAWNFVMRYSGRSLGERQKRQIAFPMAKSRDKFKGEANRRLPRVPAHQRALFERYQPYRRSEVGRSIRYLRTLSNLGKHRLIVPTKIWSPEGRLDWNIGAATLIREDRHFEAHGEIEKGTKIMTMVLSGVTPGQGQVKAISNIHIRPMFPRSLLRPPPSETVIPIEWAMNGIKNTCAEFLAEAVHIF